MKLKIVLTAFFLGLDVALAQSRELYLARAYGALAKECLRIVDQDGVPVSGANLWGGLQTGDGYNDFTPIRGISDTNGEYVIEGKCTDRIRCDITLDGYYASEFELTDYGHTHSIGGGRWLPYGSKRKIVLNKILNPIPLCCHNSRTSFRIPVYNEWVGFDFERFDFVRPHGQGLEKDMMLRFALDNPSRDDYHMSMEVSFTNNPYAGIYELPRNKSSELESVYHADTNAFYQQSIAYRFDRCPGKVPRYTQQLTSQNYLVFRTRTMVDVEGKLVSAHYGKIYGDWNFVGPGGMSMARCIFNLTPNDTNLEDSDTAERSLKRQRSKTEPPYKKRQKALWPF